MNRNEKDSGAATILCTPYMIQMIKFPNAFANILVSGVVYFIHFYHIGMFLKCILHKWSAVFRLSASKLYLYGFHINIQWQLC